MGILQEDRVPTSRGSSQPRDRTQVSCIAGGIFTLWATKGSPRILEWVAYPFSRGFSWPRNQTGVSCLAGRFFTSWATREAHTSCYSHTQRYQAHSCLRDLLLIPSAWEALPPAPLISLRSLLSAILSDLLWSLYFKIALNSCVCAKSLRSCPPLCDSLDSCLPGSSVHGILQARYWCGLPCPPPGHLPHPGIKPASLMSPALADRFFTLSITWKP